MLTGLSAQSHPLHLSFTTLEFQPETGSWNLMIKIFFDDLEESVYRQSGMRPGLISGTLHPDIARLLHQTVMHDFSLFIDGKVVASDQWKMIKWDRQEDAVSLNFQCIGLGRCSKIRVRNLILLNLFSDQKNLFIFSMGNKDEAFQFSRSRKEFEMIIKPV